jgi:hypothetical protein
LRNIPQTLRLGLGKCLHVERHDAGLWFSPRNNLSCIVFYVV